MLCFPNTTKLIDFTNTQKKKIEGKKPSQTI